MSYAQPSPPMIQTDFLTRLSARLTRSLARGIAGLCQFVLQARRHVRAVHRCPFHRSGRRSANRFDQIPRRVPCRTERSSSRAYSFCLSSVRRMPRPNSALSSNSEFDQAGPRPSLFTAHGVVGRLPP
ncbi:MAG: hypothetical protein MZV64_19050 [Ignavibacteriales bacterium]|nr:hypothetical protein [Ignavibacteriales bacterium]